MRRRVRDIAALSVVALIAVACASTSKPTVSKTQDDTSASIAPESASESAAPQVTDAAGRPVSNATVSGPGASAKPGAAQVAVPGLPRGTGTIKIGFHYSKDLSAAYAAFGAKGAIVDVEPAVNKLVAWVNAHGGLGGKKVVAVFHATNPLKGTFPEQAETACTFFAEDAHVAYVVSGAVLPDDNMMACHAKRHTPLVWDYHYLTHAADFTKYANYLYMPHMVGTERMGFLIGAMKTAGYFDPGAKVALVRYDVPVHKEYADKVVKAGLARIGMKLTAEVRLKQPHSAGEAGDVAAQVANAIVQFNRAGVTHVILVPSGGAIPLIWGPQADSQNFEPRYAFTSLDIPAFVTDNMSEEQLDRAMVVGWMPANDTLMRFAPKTKALQDCITATGVKDSSGAVRYCDGLFFLKAALDKTPRYDVAGLRSAVDSLGTGYTSPWTISTKFSSGRHDGASSYRILGFDHACVCFKFTSATKPIP